MKSVLALIGAAVLASSAVAQDSQWRDTPAPFGRKVLRQFADCTVKGEPVLARRFILMNAGERMPQAEFRRLINGRCLGFLGGQLRMRAWHSRAALAEAFLRREPARAAPADFNSLPPLDWPVAPDIPGAPADIRAREATIGQAERIVSQLGECVVRADPAGALAVLRSKQDSDQEVAAFKALTPRIADCVQEGQTLALDRTNLRSALALSYFRLAMATAPAATGSRS